MLFESPLFLAGASAAVAPLVIHFLFKRKARKVRFPSLMLLKRVRKNITRYHKIREMILLLLRMAVILLLVLALAKPFLPGFGYQGSAAVLFVIDDSISMGKICEGSSRLEHGVEFAVEILSSLSEGSKAGFVLSSMKENGILEPVEDLALVREQLREMNVSGTGASVSRGVEYAVNLLSREKGLPVELYILSDRQDEIGDISGLPDEARVFYVDCFKNEILTNVIIDSVQVPKGPFPEMSEIEVKAVVENTGDTEAKGKVTLEIGTTEDTRDIRLEKGERKDVTFRTLPLTAGIYHGRISYGPDCIPGDSERFFSIETGNPMRILILEQGGTVLSEEEKYFRSALNPWGENMNVFVLEHAQPATLSPQRFKGTDLVVCFSFLPLVDPKFTMVRDYVRDGGSLLMFPSADYDVDALNRVWDGFGSFIPWHITALDKPPKNISLRKVNFSYPGFAPLRNIVDPEKARFLQRFIVKPDQISSVTVIAEFEDRKPAALSASYGKGEVVFFSWGLSSAWTDAPYKNFFAPMMNELSRYLSKKSARGEEYPAGTPVSFPLKKETDRVSVTVPGKDVPVSLTKEGGGVLRDTFTPGCYSYVFERGSETEKNTIVFNPASFETRNAHFTRKELKGKLVESGVELIDPGPDTLRTIGEGRRGRSLRDFLLLCTIGVLLAELYMSNSMAVRKQKADDGIS